jgi:hypothetical protein
LSPVSSPTGRRRSGDEVVYFWFDSALIGVV